MQKWWFIKASMPLATLLKTLLLVFVCLEFGFSQTSISTVIRPEQRAVLEQLVVMAEASNLEVLKAEAELTSVALKLEPLGRLKEALSITGSTTLSGDYYGQISPSYSISLSLNVLDLFPEDIRQQQNLILGEAKARVRLAVIDAYLAYLSALEEAKTRALDLEATELAFRAEQARYEIGEVTLIDQVRAQTNVGQAALDLLSVNTEIIAATEKLAVTVGISIETLNQLLVSTGN